VAVGERLDGHAAKGTLRAMPARRAALALAAAGALAASGCGEDEEERVRSAIGRFEAATAAKDYPQLCRDVLSRRLVARLATIQLPCEVALRRAWGELRRPQVRIERIRVRGETALAQVTTTAAGQAPSRDTIRLVREDGSWRIATLSGAQPPAPRRPAHGD
jgi:hypothetical protein